MKSFPFPKLSWLAVAFWVTSLLGCRQTADPDLYVGYVESELVTVAAPGAGWLADLAVREGESVSIGDHLFSLESELEDLELAEASDRLRQSNASSRDLSTGARDDEIDVLEAQLAEARSNLRLAETEALRAGVLFEAGISAKDSEDRAIAAEEAARARVGSFEASIRAARLSAREAQREAADANRDVAQASLEQARWRLDQRRVTARAEGVVEQVFQQAGEFVQAGTPVLSLLRPSAIEVRFFVPQSDLVRIALGDPVRVQVDGQSEAVAGRVEFIAREAEFTPPVIYSAGTRDKLVFLVKAGFDDSMGLRPGQPVDVQLP